MKQIHRDWFEKWHREVQEEYDRLYAVAATDPQQAGHGGEATWAKFFREWLPVGYNVGLRKYIVTEDSEELFEMDIVIFNPGYPEKLQQEERILAGGVAAAFSVKLSLTPDGIKDAIDRAAKLRRAMKPRLGSLKGEVNGAFLVGLLAHSHKWKGPQSNPRRNLIENLERYDSELAMHPRETIDLICVADLAFASTLRSPYIEPVLAKQMYEQYGVDASKGVVTQGMVMTDENGSLNPLASLITSLITKLARTDYRLRPFANNLRLSGLEKSGSGNMRIFPAGEVYSEMLLEMLPYRLPDTDDWIGHLL